MEKTEHQQGLESQIIRNERQLDWAIPKKGYVKINIRLEDSLVYRVAA